MQGIVSRPRSRLDLVADQALAEGGFEGIGDRNQTVADGRIDVRPNTGLARGETQGTGSSRAESAGTV